MVSWAGRRLGDDAVLSKLAADRRDDRHREVDGPREHADRDGLEPGKGVEHPLHSARALGEPDSGRDAGDEWVDVSRRHGEGS